VDTRDLLTHCGFKLLSPFLTHKLHLFPHLIFFLFLHRLGIKQILQIINTLRHETHGSVFYTKFTLALGVPKHAAGFFYYSRVFRKENFCKDAPNSNSCTIAVSDVYDETEKVVIVTFCV